MFPLDVDWGDVCFEVDGTAYTPSEAKAAGYAEMEMWLYKGNSYDAYDDVTSGMEGTLVSQEGFWVAVLNGAADMHVKLLVAPAPNTICGTPP